MGGRGSASAKANGKNSTSSKSNSPDYEVNTKKQFAHRGTMSPGELEDMYAELGVSDPAGAVSAIYLYSTRSQYKGATHKPEDVKLIDEVIDKQPKWVGDVQVGMSVDDNFMKNIQNSIGDSIQLNAKSPTSFSSSQDVAKQSALDGTGIPVVFRMENKRGSSITHNSNYPDDKEVLHKSGEKYKVKKVVDLTAGGGYYLVELEDSE